MSEQIWDDEQLNISFELDEELVINKPNASLNFDNVLRSKYLLMISLLHINPQK